MRSIESTDTELLSLEQWYRAALAVCSSATDVDDAAELLECLGLIDQLNPRRIPA
jgi:hypothetical protein